MLSRSADWKIYFNYLPVYSIIWQDFSVQKYLTWVQGFTIILFSCFPKVEGHGQNKKKMTILKGGVDGFSYFSLISVILFSNPGSYLHGL
jgi:hypothetical protein